ncbi:hypothetical protein BHU72_07465 [Desulfuribacillus stibiiarsenatis]|uniref:Copper amine oxidase-like N-terminal domain-containing protein n=1 Tax=Desulfuribacillus stibiiarsenatis TaxID=1390249 RepID=A0A1E5L4K0_9FIRM|nr:stalk domain-containing protein [Desulfuribacillus stibiiarsenatis]OEH85016.1 hypothetical protein BHU72_07465 [Desulfuribacillus stibiiarsenatis]
MMYQKERYWGDDIVNLQSRISRIVSWQMITISIFIWGIMFLFSSYVIYATEENEWSLFVDGTNVFPDVAPSPTNEDIAIPVRFVVENLGGTVNWEPYTKVVTGKIEDQTFHIQFDTLTHQVVTFKMNEKDLPTNVANIHLQSGRTMVPIQVVEKLINSKIYQDPELQLLHVKPSQEHQLEHLLKRAADADQHLLNTLKTLRTTQLKQLQDRLRTYYSTKVSNAIIEYYYHKSPNGVYTIVPTDAPISITPVHQIETIKLQKNNDRTGESFFLSVVKKQKMFATYKVHSLYEFQLINKQWIIVEITHQLVDNKENGTGKYGGGI